ncbi:putative membrane protein [Lysinibacillus parviboronicapiens]|uniref:Membrane protein n=2 Tax=Lysinibacillus parviboronicapiens TaxID=436516 RepID=A0ABV2PRG2_9BACI
MGVGMKSAKIQLSAQEKKASAERELHQRKYGSWYLAASNLGMTILLVVLQYTSIILQNETASYFFPLFTGFMILTFGGLLLLIWRISKSNERFETIHTNESVSGDDRYWKWGIFYINKDDSALLIQKKFGVGWTVNFGNKWSVVVVLLILLPILLIIFI